MKEREQSKHTGKRIMGEKVWRISQSYKRRYIYETKSDCCKVRAAEKQEKGLGNICKVKIPIENLENKMQESLRIKNKNERKKMEWKKNL